MEQYSNTHNPILPLRYHVPDSEAHVMPDGGLYIYGSYDEEPNFYCSDKYHVVSTRDMAHWTVSDQSFHGDQVPWFGKPDPRIPPRKPVASAFMEKQQKDNPPPEPPKKLPREFKFPHLLFAPDCIEKDSTYYLYFCMPDGSEGVATAKDPSGPFIDPIRLPCSGIDPAIFMDDDGQAYYYWGQFSACGVKLNPDMVSFDPSQVVEGLVTEEAHFFHEGSSMRKIGDTYYFVFADMERGKPTSLGYATSDNPLGPFTYRGILIDNDGCDPASWNNHGSIECFHGQWYVFYHRSSKNTQRNRRLCIEPITILADGSIPEVKMTSQGPGAPFAPGERIMGYQACGLTGDAYIDEDDACGEALKHIAAGDTALFRYVQSQTAYRSLQVEARGSGTIECLLNGVPAGEITVKDGRQTGDTIAAEPGCYELCLRFTEADGLELLSVTLN